MKEDGRQRRKTENRDAANIYSQRGFGVAFLSLLSLSYCTVQDNNKLLCCCNNSNPGYIIRFLEGESSLTFFIFTYRRNVFLE